jgi:hypothetical protein
MTNNELISKPIDIKDNIEPKPLDVDSSFKLLVAFIVFSMPLWATIHTIYNLFFDRYNVFSPLWIIGLPMLPISFFMVASIAFMKRDRDVQAVIRIQKFARRYIIFLLVVAIVMSLFGIGVDNYQRFDGINYVSTEEYNKQIEEYNKQIEEYKEKTDDYNRQLDEYSKTTYVDIEFKEYIKQITQYRNKIDNYKQQLTQYRNKIDNYKQQQEEYERSHKTKDAFQSDILEVALILFVSLACEILVYFILSIVCRKCFFDVLLKNRQWIIKYGFFAGSSSLPKKDDDVIDVEIT